LGRDLKAFFGSNQLNNIRNESDGLDHYFAHSIPQLIKFFVEGVHCQLHGRFARFAAAAMEAV
jgi:hypothetical protein